MKIAVFSSEEHDITFLKEANQSFTFTLSFFKEKFHQHTAMMAREHDAVCLFVQDSANEKAIQTLIDHNIRIIALRCAGYNNVDIKAAKRLAVRVANVPTYSPYAVAEHAVGLMLCLNRKIYRSFSQAKERNFSLKGLLGFDMHGKTVGIIGTGKIGTEVARILKLGMGCKVLAYDKYPSDICAKEIGVMYTDLDTLFRQSDIITLHCPLLPETTRLIDKESIGKMKRGVMLINTSRGKTIHTEAVIEALKSKQIGYLGLDVYEEEAEVFFQDRSLDILLDDLLARLLTFPNVIITSHQGFFTKEALTNIAYTTLKNIQELSQSKPCKNEIV